MCKESDKRNEESTQDFRMLYNISRDDIKYVKGRQWAITRKGSSF